MLLYVDTIDACNLKCPTCVRGSRALPNTGEKMPLAMFRLIVAKAKDDGDVHQVDLFNWIEPFLNKNLHEYTNVVKDAGLPCGISSALSLPRIHNLEETLVNTNTLTVSVSGLDQEIYEVNHVGGNIDYVKNHLETISRLLRTGAIKTLVNLRFLKFDYNSDQEKKLLDYASNLGLSFEVLLASGHPIKWALDDQAGEPVRDRLAHFSAERPHEGHGHVCPLIFEHVAINHAGDVYLCCAYGNFEFLRIGPYLELSKEEILLRRYTHPMCNSCAWDRRPATLQEQETLKRSFANRFKEIPDPPRKTDLENFIQIIPTLAKGIIQEQIKQS